MASPNGKPNGLRSTQFVWVKIMAGWWLSHSQCGVKLGGATGVCPWLTSIMTRQALHYPNSSSKLLRSSTVTKKCWTARSRCMYLGAMAHPKVCRRRSISRLECSRAIQKTRSLARTYCPTCEKLCVSRLSMSLRKLMNTERQPWTGCFWTWSGLKERDRSGAWHHQSACIGPHQQFMGR